MDKKRELQFNLNNFLINISKAYDCKMSEYFGFKESYSKRVAYISLNLGIGLNLKPEELFDLCSLSLCHHMGVTGTKKIDSNFYERTYEVSKDFPFLTNCVFSLKKIGTSNKKSLFEQILELSIILNQKFDFSIHSLKNKDLTLDFVLNSNYDESIKNIFFNQSKNISYFLDLESENDILFFIYSSLHDFTQIISYEKLFEITSNMYNKVDIESKLMDLCNKATRFYKFEDKDNLTFKIAASLCKIGKLSIDDKILNKSSSLNNKEYEIVKSYSYKTRQYISNIMGFNDIAIWASRVQENLNGTGYPYGLDGKYLSLKDRLLKILVTYDSLISEKSFRGKYSKKEAFSILEDLATKKEIDITIVRDLESFV